MGLNKGLLAMLLFLSEIVVFLVVMLFFVTQLVIPSFNNAKLFPLFRMKKKKESETKS